MQSNALTQTKNKQKSKRRMVSLLAVLILLALTSVAHAANSTTVPDSGGGNDVGRWTSMAIDSNGFPVISYRDDTSDDLKVVHCNDVNCDGNNESITAPDTAGNVGQWTSLVLDSNGYPVVSYQDVGTNSLKVMHCNDANCAGNDESIETPDTNGGSYTSLTLDSSGNPVISYLGGSFGNADLRVMHCNDANCSGSDESITTPDTGGNVGSWTSLALDSSGNPVVSYYDATNTRLKVMHCNDPNCTGNDESITTPDSKLEPTDGFGVATSLALDSSGNPVISYTYIDSPSHVNSSIRLLHCNDPNCSGADESIAIADPNLGTHTSLTLDSSGFPVISYYASSGAQSDLRVIRCNDTNCAGNDESVVIGSGTDSAGEYSSILLDSSGNPIISYYNRGQQLQVLHCDTPICAIAGDTDGDGTPDGSDNCPSIANIGQSDTDSDGTGNACDLDDDGDNQSDEHELACGSDPLNAASTSPDADNDNIPDCVDTAAGAVIDSGDQLTGYRAGLIHSVFNYGQQNISAGNPCGSSSLNSTLGTGRNFFIFFNDNVNTSCNTLVGTSGAWGVGGIATHLSEFAQPTIRALEAGENGATQKIVGGISIDSWDNDSFHIAINSAAMQNGAIVGYEITLPLPEVAPALNVADATVDASNASISVPVVFTSNGESIASVGFSIDYDASCLSYDSYSGVPAGFVDSVTHDAGDADGELDISIFDNTTPVGTLSDGTIITINFTVLPACITTDGSTTATAINFSSDPAASFGDPSAVDVAGTSSGGTITMQFNATPTDLALSNSSVNENEAAGTVVGTLSTTDPDTGDTHTYTLVAGAGDGDNASFTIDGNQIKTAESFDFETKSSYSVRVQTDDGGPNGTFAKQLTITVNDVNDAPTDLALDNSSVAENSAVDTVVGSLSSSDQDTSDSHSYTLVTGTGDDDNGSFTIVGGQLKTSAIFDFETKSSYTVRVRTTDDGTPNLSFEKQLTITVTDVNEAPVAQNDTVDPLVKVLIGTESYNIDVLANDSDPENDTLTVASITQPAAGSATNNSTDVSFTAPGTNGTSTFTYQATDGSLNSGNATVTVYHVEDDLRGDCNGNGSVTAADFIAVVLEIFDAGSDPLHNGNPAWWRIFDGGYAGSPLGCDANASENGAGNDTDSVTIADISCTVLVFFGNTSCTSGSSGSPTGSRQAATLSLQTVQNGRSVNVRLQGRGHEVASAAFTLVVDPQATFDATDADGDGVPDAIMVNAPANMSRIVMWDADTNELHVAIFGVAASLPTLENGLLATVTLAETNGRSALSFGHVSLGNAQGGDVAVRAVNSAPAKVAPIGTLAIDNR